jgi:hypothetical protein
MLSAVKQDEIFAFCMSTSSDAVVANQLGNTFVEILDGPEFVRRVRAALPENAKFFSRAVEYYDASNSPEARWAVPEFISTAKQRSLEFQKVALSITTGQAQPTPRRNSYPNYMIEAGDLTDICRLRGA